MVVFRMLWLLMGLLAVFLGNGVQSFLLPLFAENGSTLLKNSLASNMMNMSTASTASATKTAAASAATTSHVVQSKTVSKDIVQSLGANNGMVQNLGANNGIAQNHVASNSVTQSQVASNGMAQSHVASNGMVQSHVASKSLSQSHVASNGIAHNNVASNIMAQGQVASNGMVQSHVASKSMSQSHVASNGMAQGQVASNGMVQSHVASKSLSQSHVASNGMAQGQVASNGMAQGQVASNGMVQSHVASKSMSQSHVASNGMAQGQVASNGMVQSHVASKSLSQSHVASNGMSQGQVASNGMAQGQVASNGMVQSHVASKSLSQSHVASNGMAQGQVASNDMAQSHVASKSMSQSHVASNGMRQSNLASNSMAQSNVASNSMGRSITTTTRSLVVEKKSTLFKKKCWSNMRSDKSVNLNTLEMCQKYGYNVDGLYVVPEFSKLLNSLNREQCSMASRISYPRDYSLTIKNDDEFDVVIVGCGAAGSVLAAKLSDEKDLNVLILEAGSAPLMESEIPGLWANSIGSAMDWKYIAEEDETFGQSLDNKRVKLIRGMCLGGTTALNTMLYDRGVAEDYTKFEEAGLTKWGWKDVLKYYKRSEDCKFEKITTNETVRSSHNQGGKLSVDSFRNKRTVQIRQVYSNALSAVNYSTSDFFDEKNHQGFVSSVANVDNGLRVNAAKAFLNNANGKYNLKISARSLAKRIIFDGNRAIGVEFENSVGETIRVKSNKYVISSAGPVGSPKLLLESGVRAKDLLDSLDVPLVVDNENVGSNLQAHPNFLGLVVKFETEAIRSYSISEMVFEYLMKHTGPLATIGLGSFTGFIDIDGNGTPDIQIFFYYYSHDDTVFMPSQLDALNYNDNITEQIIDLNEENDVQIVGISLLRPKNTGRVTVKKTCRGYEPVIEYGSLDREDVDTLVKAIKWVKNLIMSKAFEQYGPTIVPLKIQGGPEPDVNSEEYWRHAVKHLTSMNIQMAGTCSMATEPSKGVVNEDLEVFGTEGLMVVDSSVLPIMFSAESCAPSMMVAEKASDIIKKKLGFHDDDEDNEDRLLDQLL